MRRSKFIVPKRLLNGTIGFIIEIICPYYRRAEIYDKDIQSVIEDFRWYLSNSTKSNPSLSEVQLRYCRVTNATNIIYRGINSPEDARYTVGFSTVCLWSKLFTDGKAYVALCRVRFLDRWEIEEIDNTNLTGKKPFNNDALAEMHRKRNMQTNSIYNFYVVYIFCFIIKCDISY